MMDTQIHALYRHWDDGKQWLRLTDDAGNQWDEPITGFTEVWNLTTGAMSYRHTDGRNIFATKGLML